MKIENKGHSFGGWQGVWPTFHWTLIIETTSYLVLMMNWTINNILKLISFQYLNFVKKNHPFFYCKLCFEGLFKIFQFFEIYDLKVSLHNFHLIYVWMLEHNLIIGQSRLTCLQLGENVRTSCWTFAIFAIGVWIHLQVNVDVYLCNVANEGWKEVWSRWCKEDIVCDI